MDFEAELKRLKVEKELVRSSATRALVVGATWSPLAMGWFEKWKQYVDFDEQFADQPRSQELIQSLHPGPIDNTPLSGSFGDELKRGVVEGRDFVLLPLSLFDSLKKRYGGGPSFPRAVKNAGTLTSPLYQVILFPTRCEFYFCNAAHPEPTKNLLPTDKRHTIRYYTENVSLSVAVESVKQFFPIFAGQVRVWLLDEPRKEKETESETEQEKDDSEDYENKRIRTSVREEENGRKIRSRDVERDAHHWRLLRGDCKERLLDLLGEKDCLEIIIEHTSLFSPKESDWPRCKHLQAWKRSLRPGDLVDAKDRQCKWFAARVKGVDSEGKVNVHFLSWEGSLYDESIDAHELVDRIHCLHTHTEDRLQWDQGTQIDVCVHSPVRAGERAVWIPGTIAEHDLERERVKVVFKRSLRDENLRSFSVSSPAAVSSSSSMMDIDEDDRTQSDVNVTVDNDDDAQKKKRQSDASAETKEKEESEEVEEWFDLYGDSVAPLYTHTARPKQTTSAYSSSYYSTSSSSLYGSTYNKNSLYSPLPRYDFDANTKGTSLATGIVGLQNLGNTCFMNSILQCLSATEPLTASVFLNEVYKNQINYDNVLGHKGKVALSYAKLLKDMWSNAYTKVVPREFKTTIGESHPQFAGYDQQDSQEFLGFLLDGLHEDLNRIKKKPFVCKIESKGRPDELIAAESLRRFLLRNDSEIVDRVYGLTRSHVTCTNCQHESVKFEAFSSLSLPIPVANTKRIEVLVSLLPLGRRPVRVALEVDISLPMSSLSSVLTERLRALRVLPPAVPAATVNSNGSEKKREGEKERARKESEEDFELVSGDMDEEEKEREGFTVIEKEDALDDSVAQNEKETWREREPQFQFALSFAARLFYAYKNYVPSEAQHAAISSFVGKTDVLLAFQLEHDVCTPKMYPGSAASSTLNGGAKTFSIALSSELKKKTSGITVIESKDEKNDDDKEKEEEKEKDSVILDDDATKKSVPEKEKEEEEETVCETEKESTPGEDFAIDLCVATREKETDKFTLRSSPLRLCFRHGTRNADVHAKVRAVLRRFVRKTDTQREGEQAMDVENERESESDAALPYELLLTNPFGTIVRHTVREDEQRFVCEKRGADMLVAVCAVPPVADTVSVRVWDEKEFVAEDSPLDAEEEEENADDDDLSENSPLVKKTKQEKPSKKKKTLSVYDCLDKFVEKERLADTETIYCSSCKQHIPPIKKMDVFAAPDVLVLHLKRFQIVPGQGFHHREKITELITFPVEGLDLSKYIIGPQNTDAPAVYDLYAVSHHMGGLGGGHYVATVKNHVNGKWYSCNDSMVSQTTYETAISPSAYVLFYKRRTGSLKWGGVVPLVEGLPDDEDD